MQKNKEVKPQNPPTERRGRLRIIWIVTVRIIVLAAVVVGYSLTMPWRIIVPLGIGTITILIEAIVSIKRPSAGKEKISNARREKATGKKDNKKTV